MHITTAGNAPVDDASPRRHGRARQTGGAEWDPGQAHWNAGGLTGAPVAPGAPAPAGGQLGALARLSALAGRLPVLPGARTDSTLAAGQNPPTERDDGADQARAEALAQPTNADIIHNAERDIEPGSRAFDRMHAREQAVTRFREHRAAFREALSQASQSRPQSGPADQGKAHVGAPQHDASPAAARGHATAERPAAPPAPAVATRAAHVSPHALNVGAAATSSTAPPVRTPGAPPAGAQPVSPIQHTAATRAAGAFSAAAQPGAAAAPPGAAAARASSAAPSAAFGAALRSAPRAAAADSAGKPQPGAPAERAQRDEQIVRVLRRALARGDSRIVMRLAPAELGKLRMEAELRGDRLRLRVHTDTRLAHQLLSEESEALRESLREAGIRLERIEVLPPSPGQAGAAPGPSAGESTAPGGETPQDDAASPEPRQDAGGSASEDHRDAEQAEREPAAAAETWTVGGPVVSAVEADNAEREAAAWVGGVDVVA